MPAIGLASLPPTVIDISHRFGTASAPVQGVSAEKPALTGFTVCGGTKTVVVAPGIGAKVSLAPSSTLVCVTTRL